MSDLPLQDFDVAIPGEPEGSARVPTAERAGKGVINLVHLYPREMSIYGDLGNTRCLAARIRRHGYSPVVAGRTRARCASRPTSSTSATASASSPRAAPRCS